MNKNELCAAIVADIKEKHVDIKVSQKIVSAVLSSLPTAVYAGLKDGGEVNLPGLVKIGTKVQPGRSGIINFGDKAGEEWVTEDKTVPSVKALKPLKDAVL